VTAPEEKKKPHVSPSQVGRYCQCGESYRRRYILGEKLPPGVAMVRGTAIHKGAEFNFKQKLKTREDLPEAQIVDKAVSTFEEKIKHEGLMLSEDELARGEKVIVAEGKDEVAGLAKVLHSGVFPRYQPKLIEEEQRIELPAASHDLMGIIDLIDDKETIVDFKTSGKTKSQEDVDGDGQFTFYGLLYKAKFKKECAGISIENLVTTKTPKVVTLKTTRDNGDYQALINRVNMMLNGIKAEIFTPAPPGAWWCGPKWCGYYSTCPYVKHK